jgi:rhamnulokinase
MVIRSKKVMKNLDPRSFHSTHHVNNAAMSAHHYLGIDLGAESGRVMLGTLSAGKLSLEELHRFPNGAVRLGDTLRWDVLRLWQEIKTGLRLAAQRGLPYASVSVDSWAIDYVLMSEQEPMIRAPFCYRDSRTESTYESLRRNVGEQKIYGETGIQFMPINTLYHLAAEAKSDPELHAAATRFLMIGDWFHYLLCGRAAQEESNASSTQLWNPARRSWSDELIQAAGLPRHLFPTVVPPCSRLGRLQAALQIETGLNGLEVVAGCVHDTGAAVAAVPAAEGDNWAYLSSGTWSLIGVELPKPLLTEEARAANFTNETGVGGTSRFLRNASGLWILQECKRIWAESGNQWSYDELTAFAAKAEPFRSLIDPAAAVFLRPCDMPKQVREACRARKQPEPETPGQFTRCILESLALAYRRLLNGVEKITGRNIETLYVVGGGSKSALLNQMTADATGHTVVAGPVEATVIGNILLQALTLGHIQSHAELRAIVRNSFPLTTYHPTAQDEWRGAAARGAELEAGRK